MSGRHKPEERSRFADALAAPETLAIERHAAEQGSRDLLEAIHRYVDRNQPGAL